MTTWARVAVLAWTATALFTTVKNATSPIKGTVYPLYSDAARELLLGCPPHAKISRQHLPHFAGVMAPVFAGVPDRVGGTAWGFVQLAILFTGVRAAGRQLLADERSREILFVVVPVVSICSLGNNQSNLLIAGCLAWGTALAGGGRWWLAAFVLAVPGYKLYPLGFGLTLAVLYPRPFAGRFAVALAAVVLSPYLFHPADDITARFVAVRDYLAGGEHYVEYDFQGVRELLNANGFSIPPATFAPVQAATAALVPLALFVARRRGMQDRELVAWGAILFGFWCVSFGPSIEPQTYTLAAVPFGLLIARRGYPVSTALLVIAALVCGPLETDLVGRGVRTAVVGSKLACVGVTAALLGSLAVVLGAVRFRSVQLRELLGYHDVTERGNGMTGFDFRRAHDLLDQIEKLDASEQLYLMARVADHIRKTHFTDHEALEREMEAMANDPDMQRVLRNEDVVTTHAAG